MTIRYYSLNRGQQSWQVVASNTPPVGKTFVLSVDLSAFAESGTNPPAPKPREGIDLAIRVIGNWILDQRINPFA